MPNLRTFTLSSKKNHLEIKITKGHFATSHSHTNYYIDVITQKTNLKAAKATAEELLTYFKSTLEIATILCLDNMEVVGTFISSMLTSREFININSGKDIAVLSPERTTGSQLIFRDNTVPMIDGKKVLILASSVTTGYTAQSSIAALKYYGGTPVAVASVFATTHEVIGIPVYSVFDPSDLKDYSSYPTHDCPMCKNGEKVDAIINGYGYSRI